MEQVVEICAIVAVATGETTLSDVTMSLTASYGQGGADLATKPMICTNID